MITNAMRLLKLHKDVQKMLVDGRLSAGHARAILALEDPKQQLKIARNTSGSKYKKCPYCGNQSTGNYYVDPYGTCYHTSVNCSALKRTVHERDLDECGHMHECKDCRKARGG